MLPRKVIFLLTFLVIFVSTTLGQVRGRQRGKKKVVIIGEMSDLAYELATNSSNYALSDVTFEDYEEFAHRQQGANLNRPRPLLVKRTGYGHQPVTASPSGSVFVPVAAYSVTHSRVNGDHRGSSSVRRPRPVQKRYQLMPSSSSPDKTTESAVYGYVQKPEIVEFRGQYFYGPNPVSGSSHHEPVAAATGPSSQSWASAARISNKAGGLGPGGLLLATLPLILAPMLSYLFTPMIIPVTATIAAGRRRKRRSSNLDSSGPASDQLLNRTHASLSSILGNGSMAAKPLYLNIPTSGPSTLDMSGRSGGDDGEAGTSSSNSWSDPRLKELQVVADYLRKVHFDEKDRDKAMANYLQCDGMFDSSDHCLERLACEFSDPASYGAPELDRAVTSILIGHILSNEFISGSLKKNLKSAAVFGRSNSGLCARFPCAKIN